MDYPGTLPVRRSAFLAAGGYDGDVLFENLELMRTLRASGARLTLAPQALVRRLPPGFRHFLGQRVREAYDSQAQPASGHRAGASADGPVCRRDRALPVLPSASARPPRWPKPAVGGTGSGGVPWYVPLLAPAWLAERSVCSWLALGCRLRGGVPYAGQRLPCAATPVRRLRPRARPSARPEPGTPSARASRHRTA